LDDDGTEKVVVQHKTTADIYLRKILAMIPSFRFVCRQRLPLPEPDDNTATNKTRIEVLDRKTSEDEAFGRRAASLRTIV
jgi:hypothetical protein